MRGLTVKEKATLCGLIWHPDATDREIAEKLKMPTSTVTAIRRRLREKDLFRFAYLPMLNMLGHELLVVSYGSFDPNSQDKVREMFLAKLKDVNPKIFAQCRNHENWLMMSNAANYTEAKKNLDALEEFIGKHGIANTQKISHILFPYAVTDMVNFFDFRRFANHIMPAEIAPLLCKSHYELPQNYAREVLTKKELQVLAGLVNYPEEPISNVASRIKVSRQCISRTEKELKARKILRPIIVPNLHSLDYRYLVALHLQYKTHVQRSDRERIASTILDNFPVMFFVSGTFESFIVTPVRTFDECIAARKTLIELHASHDMLRSAPTFMFFPTEHMACLQHFDFKKCIGGGKL
ncbi:MAG: winged helix-turn-helix domain-containing protein [Thermoplasmata archaeon]|nr:winged helix-turn-helix domain-containing protein [Thermoplasmata archaeon]